MNNISIEIIKKQLEEVKQLFDPSKSSYQILNSCTANNMTAEEMLNQLKKLGDTKNYPQELRQFFYNRYQELEALSTLDQNIKENLEKLNQANQNLEQELKTRNVNYISPIKSNPDYLNMTYNDKKQYLSQILEETDKIKNQKIAVNKEKLLGEKYDQTIIEANSVDTNKQEINKIQKDAENNKVTYINPLLSDVRNYYNYFKTNQREKASLNVKVDYTNSNAIKVNIGYKGTEVSEKEPMIECFFMIKHILTHKYIPFY